MKVIRFCLDFLRYFVTNSTDFFKNLFLTLMNHDGSKTLGLLILCMLRGIEVCLFVIFSLLQDISGFNCLYYLALAFTQNITQCAAILGIVLGKHNMFFLIA